MDWKKRADSTEKEKIRAWKDFRMSEGIMKALKIAQQGWQRFLLISMKISLMRLQISPMTIQIMRRRQPLLPSR